MSVLLVDLSSVFWRNWHATKHEEVSTAYENTINLIERFAANHDNVGICLDSPPYWRHEIYPEYKAGREEKSELAVGQMVKVQDELERLGYPLFAANGYEADDIIATLERGMNHDLTILTSDKDLCQLLQGTNRTVVKPNGNRITADDTEEVFGVEPHQIGTLLALMGDKADNIPGLPGVGMKRAQEIIGKIGDVDAILAACIASSKVLDELKPPSLKTALLHNMNVLELSHTLVSLKTGAPVDSERLFAERIVTPRQEAESGLEGQSEASEAKQEIIEVTETKIVKASEWTQQLEPTTGQQAWKAAQILCDSRLYQQHGGNVNSMFAIIMRGRELGMGATTALDAFHIIKGKPVMSATLMVGLVLNSGKADFFKLTESTSELATYKTHRKDDPDPDPTVLSFTIEDAQRLGLAGKENWRKQPATMLRHRCAAALARAVYPDLVGGLYVEGEIE